jgi:hypothetical protein
MQKYSGLDVGKPLGQGMFKLHFLTNNRPDITKETYKNLKNWKDKNMKELLREAQRFM